MPQIIIREQAKTDTGFRATVSFDGRGEYPISISEPFTPQQEKDLEWYFEEWLVYPMLGRKKVERVESSILSYGEALFEQVFGNRKVYSQYEEFKNSLSQLEIIIESKTPEFQAFHWEVMRDPDLPRPLTVDCVMVRKKLEPSSVRALVESSPVINLLVVVARPDEEEDAGYRTISRPLVELIDNSQLPVRVDILRPGTYEALSKHLDKKGEGFYHIIHLDLHGALLTYKQIQKPAKPKRYFYQGRYGRNDIEPFNGLKAFLAFEEEEKGKVDLVEAQELTDLLTGKGIPVCILNACQSGKQVRSPLTTIDKEDKESLPLEKDAKSPLAFSKEGIEEDSRETSLGSRLMQAGMQMVVAMGYSVTVSAAKLMMEQLYQHLFGGEEITHAIRLARKELYNKKGRKAYFNQVIDLEDWLLPVVYSNQKVNFQLREFTPEEDEKYWKEVGSQYRFGQPSYGFIGRDLDILKLEKALLNHNILLMRGMGGTGKTTLLNYLREWWQRTNFVEDVFYFGYDEKAWTLEQILFFIGQQVYGKFEAAKFQVMNPTAQVQKLARKLKAEPYALMLDNLESVTGKELAIQNTLPEAERNEIRDFLGLLVGGKTKIILGSRSGEEWLQEETFRDNIHQLQGLDREARTELAEKILERNLPKKEIPKIREDEHFQKLMKLLAGYPLAMEVLLANLKQQTPEQILQGLEAADIDVDTGSEDKTKSILKCVEYSHSNLSPEAQKLLLCLAPFSGFIWQGGLAHYGEELKKLEPFKDYDFSQFDQAIEEAINWGLLSTIDPNLPECLSIQPVFPYFLKTKLKEVDAEIPPNPPFKGGNKQGGECVSSIGEALREGFKNHYLWLASYNYNHLMNSNDANERQRGTILCRWEYENLYKALQICLQKQETLDIFFCLDKYFTLIQDIKSKLNLAKYVAQALENYPPEIKVGNIGWQSILVLDRLGYCYLATKNYSQAKKTYLKTIDLQENLTGVDTQEVKRAQSSTYHQLGGVSLDSREYEQAKSYYQKALQICDEYGDRYSQAFTYHQLGYLAQDLREYEQAKEYYQQALVIFVEYGDRYSQAGTYHELGYLAQNLREYEQAKEYYQQALQIKVKYGDRYSQASTYQQLGIVAQELREYKQAKEYYQQALQIKVEYGDRYSQASTYHELGYLAQNLREYEQAKEYYQQALQIKVEYGDRYSQTLTYHELGRVAQALREYEQAKEYYQQALAICVEYGDRYSQAGTYGQLGLLAKELNEYQEAKDNFLKAFEIYVAYQDKYYIDIILSCLAELYQASQEEDILSQTASILGISQEEASQIFENFLGNS